MNCIVFFIDECIFWYIGGMYVLFFLVGGWVQLLLSVGYVELFDLKCCFLLFVQVLGFVVQFDLCGVVFVMMVDLLCIYLVYYFDVFCVFSDVNGGDFGDFVLFGKGSYEIVVLLVGFVIVVVDVVVGECVVNVFLLLCLFGYYCLCDCLMGFCMLVNILIVIEVVCVKYGIECVVVIDWDVYYGNGMQLIYYDDLDMLMILLYQDCCFLFGYSGVDDCGEGVGIGVNLNVLLFVGSGDDVYWYVFEWIVLLVFVCFCFELIVIVSGFDVSVVDLFVCMQLYIDSYWFMMCVVKEVVQCYCGGWFVIVYEGGYLEVYVLFCGFVIVEELVGVCIEVVDLMFDLVIVQQLGEWFVVFQCELFDELVVLFGL